jgi:hypothetical protein
MVMNNKLIMMMMMMMMIIIIIIITIINVLYPQGLVCSANTLLNLSHSP